MNGGTGGLSGRLVKCLKIMISSTMSHSAELSTLSLDWSSLYCMLHEKSKEVGKAILCNVQLPPGISVPNFFHKEKD